MTTKNVTITVAIIGALATLGAAILPNLGKPKDAPAPIQQTASGAGAINVGRDAQITNNINSVKSAGEEAAERVQACEAQHGMKTASDKIESTEKIPAGAGGIDHFIGHISFRSCVWPVTRYTDADGYLEIKLESEDGPGQYEATGTTDADRITAPCRRLSVAYQFGNQGVYDNPSPITINADTLVTADGKPWKNEDNALPFYPVAGEFVILHNSHQAIQSARCL